MTSFTCHDVRFDVAGLPEPGHVPAVCRGVRDVPVPGAGVPPGGPPRVQPPLLPGAHLELPPRDRHPHLYPVQGEFSLYSTYI